MDVKQENKQPQVKCDNVACHCRCCDSFIHLKHDMPMAAQSEVAPKPCANAAAVKVVQVPAPPVLIAPVVNAQTQQPKKDDVKDAFDPNKLLSDYKEMKRLQQALEEHQKSLCAYVENIRIINMMKEQTENDIKNLRVLLVQAVCSLDAYVAQL